MARTHLFVAPQKGPFGEAALGIRIAKVLCEQGDRVIFWAPRALGVLAEGSAVVHIERAEQDKVPIDEAVVDLAKKERADSVVLLDVASVYLILAGYRRDKGFVERFDVPVIGLDVWNLAETGFRWDMCGAEMKHSPRSSDVTKRLIPVPFARPTGQAGLYNALPPTPVISDEDRADCREDFGIERDDRMVLLTSAEWQNPSAQPHPNGRRLAALFPGLVAELVDRLDPRAKIIHVGPRPYPVSDKLGRRYTWLAQRSPPRFARLLLAADLYLSFNFSGTTIHSAISARIPIVLGVSSRSGTTDEVLSQLVAPPSPAVRSWLEAVSPLRPFRAFPLGLFACLAPLAVNNPYTSAFTMVEVLDEDAFVNACHLLLFDEDARRAARAAQDAYVSAVSRLPWGSDLLRSYL
jgi:hypothetical protein